MVDYIGTTLSLVVIAVAVIIGIVVFANVSTSIDKTSLTAAQNTTIDTVITNTNTGFKLLAVGLIVLAAGAILAILLTFGRPGAGGM